MVSSELPSAQVVELSPNLVLQPPLSRCGHGPGLVLLRPASYAGCQQQSTSLDPEPLKKWAEESFTVAQITLDTHSSGNKTSLQSLVQEALDGLIARPECDPKHQFGVLVYGSKADYAPQFEHALHGVLTGNPKLAALVSFDFREISGTKCLVHALGQGDQPPRRDDRIQHHYADVSSPGFVVPGHPDFKYSTAGVCHTRSIAFLKKHLGGPYFDLEQIWDEHTYFEFGDRSVEKTMATMVQEPYVNHIPTMTGGLGRARLSHFYLHHFIFNNPDDTGLELISRTVGTDRVVDEFIFSFTHVKQVDWLIPGIPPTGKHLRIPFTSVVNIRGDRLYHEHIAWDQATVLVQLGLMPEYLPFPYTLADGRLPAPGKRFEYRVPAAGAEAASKLQNGNDVPSNGMFEYTIREVDDQ
ncbi:hypothetical protein N7532_012084 [Penicillium argentinense]|uniref:Carboxymethylenebutenolidase n=1 Tax=Penicillium argentinense TaxID=1131581 RepID=A0A9W9JVM4_9EURO|nr:uncharacterized protein N7532_012084 [Penicillium argentinense]KAJ5083041.1 hypothetical protein N7532_012084 [Penicillium argentinense]